MRLIRLVRQELRRCEDELKETGDSRNESLDGTLRGGSGDINGEVDRRVRSGLSREEVLDEGREDVGCGSGGVPREKKEKREGGKERKGQLRVLVAEGRRRGAAWMDFEARRG